jgi:hypothetical protein
MKKVLVFTKALYLQNSKDAIEYVFVYDVKEDNTILFRDYKIKLSISGTLAAGWGFKIWSPTPEKDYVQLLHVLYELAKNDIIRKFYKGLLNSAEEITLLSANMPLVIPFQMNNLTGSLNIEIEF